MRCNMSGLDRALRILAGLVLLGLGWSGIVTGTVGTVMKWLGFVPLVTGLLTWCPLYSIIGYDGCRRATT